ncbi:MAG: TolC family protein [Planctomycetota bacterium]|nr:TolC family protein [Planctomycetota bacterium]
MMKCKTDLRRWLKLSLAATTLVSGCRGPVQRFSAWRDSKDTAYFQSFAHQIEYPDVASVGDPDATGIPLPLAITNPAELPAWELSLQEAVQTSLRKSDVLRSLGGSVVQGTATVQTTLDPGLTESNPQAGIEAALSAFDAQTATQLFWGKNDRPNNQQFAGFIPPAFQQTTGNYINGVSKTTATGGVFTLSSNVIYDRNNNPNQNFPSSFSGFLQAGVRQPLMQGSGLTYNRIAGPTQYGSGQFVNPQIGVYNGVLIARVNMDISLADFENGVIKLVNDIETAYWELYFAYRALDAQVTGRENALRTWQRINELKKVSARGGEADAEAQARSQYYLFDSQVNDALAGPQGLYTAEQRLRYLMGVAASDGRLIKPTDLPLQAEVNVDWFRAVADATTQRVEVRRQKWTVKRREMELLASRLNRRARLDLVSQYRWRGLGDHLIGSRNPDNSFESLAQNVTEGNFQEWQAGMEWSYNVGLRQASSGVRNAQLNLVRENSLLKEIELKISHDLSNAYRQMDRSFAQVQTNYNRVAADTLQVEVLRNRYERGLININILLLAQQQLATSTSSYYRSLTDYMLAMRDFHREKGSLLGYNQVQLSEAGYSGDAYRDAYQKGRDYTPFAPGIRVQNVEPGPFSAGPFDPTAVGEELPAPLMTEPDITTTIEADNQ